MDVCVSPADMDMGAGVVPALLGRRSRAMGMGSRGQLPGEETKESQAGYAAVEHQIGPCAAHY